MIVKRSLIQQIIVSLLPLNNDIFIQLTEVFTMTKLQIALDDISFEDALILLEKIKSYIDIIEVGTPFMMEYGMIPIYLKNNISVYLTHI